MGVDDEFETVEILLASDAETRGVDAFALALIKAERQMRKLVTYLVFQSAAFGPGDIAALRNALAAHKIFFRHFLAAWDDLYPRPLRQLVGSDHDRLRDMLDEATDHRNKIFHGQLTTKFLSREEMIAYVADIRCWCRTLATAAQQEIGYDGFDRGSPLGSFRKSADTSLGGRLLLRMATVQDYESFLKELERRPNTQMQRTRPAQATEPRR